MHASCGHGGAATYSDLEAARPARFSSKTADLGSFRPGGFAHKATILVASAEQLPALCTCRLCEDVVVMIRQLCPHDAEALFDFRRRSLLDAPLALTASPQDDIVASVEAARELLGRSPGSVVFGAFDGELVGMLGFRVDRQLKRSHLGHVWGMYVARPCATRTRLCAATARCCDRSRAFVRQRRVAPAQRQLDRAGRPADLRTRRLPRLGN